MLSELRIRNFAIIESLALPLAPGFNVLTGETGAEEAPSFAGVVIGGVDRFLHIAPRFG